MDLRLPVELADGYTSLAQRARVTTEAWASANLYCLACESRALTAHTAGRRVEDYACPRCDARYQLKAKAGRYGRSVANSAYEWKIKAIREGRAPHYAFLSYDPTSLAVSDLFVLPGHFLVESAVEKRKALAATARRAGWVGSNILLGSLPPDARVAVVAGSRPRPPQEVREDFARFSFLNEMRADTRGWTADVLACVRRIGRPAFTLDEAYAFEDELQRRHPANRNVRPKIRQQLQVLRDRGILAFEERGTYRFRDG